MSLSRQTLCSYQVRGSRERVCSQKGRWPYSGQTCTGEDAAEGHRFPGSVKSLNWQMFVKSTRHVIHSARRNGHLVSVGQFDGWSISNSGQYLIWRGQYLMSREMWDRELCFALCISWCLSSSILLHFTPNYWNIQNEFHGINTPSSLRATLCHESME